jgi:hypothetical protein
MSWFGEPKDLIAIVIATLAVILSLVTVLIQKQQQQRDAYRQIYDVLMSPELHRGRWMIVDIGKGKTRVLMRVATTFRRCVSIGRTIRPALISWGSDRARLLADSTVGDHSNG